MATLPHIVITARLPWYSWIIVRFFACLRWIGLDCQPEALTRWLCRRGVWLRADGREWWWCELACQGDSE